MVARSMRAGTAEADAGDAVIGRDLHHREVHVCVGVLAVGDRLVAGPAVFAGSDAGDFHGVTSCVQYLIA